MLGNAVAFLGDASEARRVYDALSARHGRPVLASMVGAAALDLSDRALWMLAAARIAPIASTRAALAAAARLGTSRHPDVQHGGVRLTRRGALWRGSGVGNSCP